MRRDDSAAVRRCALVAALIAVAPCAAQYPERPIRVIVPNAPGSTTDLLGRIVMTRMSDRLGRQLVIDNRPGAGGTLGMEMAARATPDGYSIVAVAASQMTIAPHVYRRTPYDPLKDFVPIGMFVKATTALCVHAALPVKTVRDLVELARAKPGQLVMSSAGVGSTSHLGDVMFATLAGIQANHVPYKGGGPSILAVAQGEAHFTVPPLSAAMPQVKAGRVRCVATGGDRRSAVTPDLPTIAEAGVAGFRYYGWNGLLGPRGFARTHVMVLNRVMGEVLTSAEIRKPFLDVGEEPVHGTPEEFARLIREDYEQMGKLVKLAGIQPE